MSSRRSLVLVLAHVVWATERRRPFLHLSADAEIRALIENTAQRMGCAALAVGLAMDHVHVLLRLSPNVALVDAVQRLKGVTAQEVLRRDLLDVLRWEPYAWAESVAVTDLELVVRHIRGQREHHDTSMPITERWELDVERDDGGPTVVH